MSVALAVRYGARRVGALRADESHRLCFRYGDGIDTANADKAKADKAKAKVDKNEADTAKADKAKAKVDKNEADKTTGR